MKSVLPGEDASSELSLPGPLEGGGQLAIKRSETLAKQTYVVLRRAVRRGVLTRGNLYSEVQIAEMLRISRTPVREALVHLVRQGIIEKIGQQGFRLREVGARERRELYDLRRAVESYVVRRLAAESSHEQVAGLKVILKRQEETLRGSLPFDSVAFSEAGEAFHLSMPSLIGLERSAEILETLRGVLWVSGVRASERRERPAKALDEHRAILRGVERHDSDAAEHALLFHLDKTAEAARPDRTTSIGEEE
jgi:DNA-binding GntR family transcriptional regulator